MSARSIDNQILKYLPLLEQDEKKSILTVIRSFLKHKEAEPSHHTVAEYNKELDDAMARIDAGHLASNEDIMKDAASW